MLDFLANFMRDGGTFMWVILLVWLTGLGLSFYKYIILKSSDINGNKLFDTIKGHVLQNNVDEALNVCSEHFYRYTILHLIL